MMIEVFKSISPSSCHRVQCARAVYKRATMSQRRAAHNLIEFYNTFCDLERSITVALIHLTLLCCDQDALATRLAILSFKVQLKLVRSQEAQVLC